MYLNSHPNMQQEFFDLLLHVLNNHSDKSRRSFLRCLEKLQNREGDVIEIYSVWPNESVGILFRRVDEYGDPDQGDPYMVGGLEYHSHSDEWSVNT